MPTNRKVERTNGRDKSQATNATKKVRYAVIGLGWIAQEAVLPAFRHTKNSAVVALVTGDKEKTSKVAKQHGIEKIYSYDEYDQLVKSGEIDAVYIATPNNKHTEFAIAAARAGVHVLCEKPMSSTSKDFLAMIEAAEKGVIKLMVAYRLHFEPANLKAISLITSGEIGEPRIFSSVFCQLVEEGNARLKKDLAGGPLLDMGIYAINAARYCFREEPAEVMAFAGNNGEKRFAEVPEAVSVIMRFPNDRLASFTCSFGAAPIDHWYIIGTKGWIELVPGFEYHEKLKLHTSIDEQENQKTIPMHDQFGGEIVYFSDCILGDRAPEPSGPEGMPDVRIIEAAHESIREGKPVKPWAASQAATPASWVVRAASPSGG
jgi:predicted dehydrogenase